MTWELARAVDTLNLPPAPGLSSRAVAAVLRYMSRVCSDVGEFRWGMSAAKVSRETTYSVATVRRAQAYLVTHGLLERVRTGGGRASTHWKVAVSKLRPSVSEDPSAVRAQPDRHEHG